MARESDELMRRRMESDAALAQRNAEAIAAERKALDKLHSFSAQTPSEKQQQTREASLSAVATHEAVQAKPAPAENKRAAPPAENKADALADVPLTDAAKRKAEELGLTAADFKRKRKSGANGEFTVDDVERIAGAE